MTANIDEAIVGLAVDIESLKHLDVNARRGNVNFYSHSQEVRELQDSFSAWILGKLAL